MPSLKKIKYGKSYPYPLRPNRFSRWTVLSFLIGLLIGTAGVYGIYSLPMVEKPATTVSKPMPDQSRLADKNFRAILSKLEELKEEYRNATAVMVEGRGGQSTGGEDNDSKLAGLDEKLSMINESIQSLKKTTSNESTVKPPIKLEYENRLKSNIRFLSGRVLDENDAPISGVRVEIEGIYAGITDENGEFSEVPVGNYSVQALSEETKLKGIFQPEGQETDEPDEASPDENEKEGGDDERSSKPGDENLSSARKSRIFFCERIIKKPVPNARTRWVPIGERDAFRKDIGKVVCYAHILSEKNLKIKHRWFWKDLLQVEIPMEVKATEWRTRSEKRISPGQTGIWRVDVTTEDGETILANRDFLVK